MRISDWSSDVFSSDLRTFAPRPDVKQAAVEFLGEIAQKKDIVIIWRVEFQDEEHALIKILDDLMEQEGGFFVIFFFDRHVVQIKEPCGIARSEEHTSELQSLMRISYDVFCLKKKT